MTVWSVHHRAETVSTNADALSGVPGDVFTADFQTAGRGRLDHRWLSPPGANLMMSAVLNVAAFDPERVATLPIAVGLAVAEALSAWLTDGPLPQVKWPNDVLAGGRKIAGILCERRGDRVIAGIGVNVGQTVFPPELAEKATSLALLGRNLTVTEVRDAVLTALDRIDGEWRSGGLAGLHPRLAARDFLKGKTLAVRQTDSDPSPLRGLCGGILADGTLEVGGMRVYAGEAHVENFF